jgi:hypothetical protein
MRYLEGIAPVGEGASISKDELVDILLYSAAATEERDSDLEVTDYLESGLASDEEAEFYGYHAAGLGRAQMTGAFDEVRPAATNSHTCSSGSGAARGGAASPA